MLGHGHRGVKGEQRNPAGTHGDAEGDLEHERWDQRLGNPSGDDRRSRAAGAGKRYRRDHRHVMAPSSPMLAGSSPEATSSMTRRSASARRTENGRATRWGQGGQDGEDAVVGGPLKKKN